MHTMHTHTHMHPDARQAPPPTAISRSSRTPSHSSRTWLIWKLLEPAAVNSWWRWLSTIRCYLSGCERESRAFAPHHLSPLTTHPQPSPPLTPHHSSSTLTTSHSSPLILNPHHLSLITTHPQPSPPLTPHHSSSTLTTYHPSPHTHARTHTHPCTRTHTHIRALTHTCMHTHTHTCTHTCMHISTHTHTHMHKGEWEAGALCFVT